MTKRSWNSIDREAYKPAMRRPNRVIDRVNQVNARYTEPAVDQACIVLVPPLMPPPLADQRNHRIVLPGGSGSRSPWFAGKHTRG